MQPMTACSNERPIWRRESPTATLLRERADLEEEVRQLRAAVQVYREVVRRLSAPAQLSNQRQAA
jgi:hypothetical protein